MPCLSMSYVPRLHPPFCVFLILRRTPSTTQESIPHRGHHVKTPPQKLTTNPTQPPEPNLKQCWFPGVHTNVGGGYPDQHMADISLFWMLEQCRGLLDFEELYISQIIQQNHYPQYNGGKLRKGVSKIYPDWALGRIEDSFWSQIMPLLGKAQRLPGRYRLPRKTNETMHRSVRERWKSLKVSWRPPALSGFSLVQLQLPTPSTTPQCHDDHHTPPPPPPPASPKPSSIWTWAHTLPSGLTLSIPEDPFPVDSPTSWQYRLRNMSSSRRFLIRRVENSNKHTDGKQDRWSYLRDDYVPPLYRHRQSETTRIFFFPIAVAFLTWLSAW